MALLSPSLDLASSAARSWPAAGQPWYTVRLVPAPSLRPGPRRGLLLLWATLWSSAAPAQTESPRLDLALEAPAGCPSRAEIVAAIEAVVHTAPAETLHVGARITRDAGPFTLTASFAGGQRSLQGDSCEDVSRALVAIVALAIDPSAEVSAVAFPRADATPSNAAVSTSQPASDASGAPPAAPPPRPDEPPPSHPPNAAAPSVANPASDAQREGPTLVFGGSLWALGEVGSLPSASYGVAGVARGSLGPWSAELGAGWLSPKWAEVSSAPDKGGEISWFSVQANGCRRIVAVAAACGGVELGEMRGQGENVAEIDGGGRLWLAPALAAALRGPISRTVALEARIGLAFPLVRPSFTLEPYGQLHQPYWLSGRLLLGIAYR